MNDDDFADLVKTFSRIRERYRDRADLKLQDQMRVHNDWVNEYPKPQPKGSMAMAMEIKSETWAIRLNLQRHGYHNVNSFVDLIKLQRSPSYDHVTFVNYKTNQRTQTFPTLGVALEAAKPKPIPVTELAHDGLEWS